MPNLIDLSNQRFGTLTVTELARVGTGRATDWRAICDCGYEVVRQSHKLRNGGAHCPNCGEGTQRHQGPLTEFVTESGCEIWLPHDLDWNGYGRAYFGGRLLGAHRVRWMLERGPIPEGLFVLHRCDVRCCVNLDHLFLGTHQDNMDDMKRKGRSCRGRTRQISKEMCI